MIEDGIEISSLVHIKGEQVKSSELAICFEMEGSIPYEEGFPRSQLHEGPDGRWYCRKWLAEKKGLVA